MEKKPIHRSPGERIFRNGSFLRRFLGILSLLVIGNVGITMAQAVPKFTVNFKDVSLMEVLDYLGKNSDYTFTYNSENVKNETAKITESFKDATLEQVLTKCLEKTRFDFNIVDKHVMIAPRKKPEVNLIKVSGRIVDEKGNPVAGATIVIVGTTQGVASDADGHYTIAAKADDVLRASFIGYETKTVEVKGKERVNIRLTPTAENLEEVQVVAFGTQKKESVTGSITTIRPMDLKSSNSDLTASLTGKIAGIVGWQTGGAPGALTEDEMNTKFYIRGISSSNGASEPLVLIDGVESSRLDLARMAPEDMESFSVLKDAAATAMYGARGANGVIIVTTKKGEAGSVYTSVRYEAVASMPTDKIDVVDPQTYMRMYNEALMTRNPEASPRYSLTRIERTGSKNYPSWVYPANDWFKILFKDHSVNQRVGVNVRGGSETVQYYASVNYVNDKGMLKSDRLNQYKVNIDNSTLSSRINLNVNLSTGLRMLVNASVNYDKYHGPFFGQGAVADVQEAYYYAYNASPVNFAPTYPGDFEHGWPHLRFGSVPQGQSVALNPYAVMQRAYQDRSRYSATTRVECIYNLARLLKGLELRASASLSKTGYEMNAFETSPFYYTMDAENGGYDFETGEHKLTLLQNGRRTLEKPIQGGSASTSSTQLVYEGSLIHTAAWGGDDATLHQTSLTAVFQALQANSAPVSDLFSSFEQRNLSFSMRGSYGFMDRYFVEASFGYNGSERFTKNNRMGFFPAVSGAWLASKENFMQGAVSRWVSFLKLRGSWGKVGNDGIIKDPRFVYMPEIVGGPNYKDPEPGSENTFSRKEVKNYGDPDVKWEVSEQVNLGIETRFFKDILEINADFYQEVRHNIIEQRVTIPAQIGVEVNPLDNMGKVRARGMDLSAKVQHAFNKDFWVILNGTFTYNKAIYKELEEAKDRPYWQLKTGYELSQRVGYIAEGLFRDQAEIDNSPQANTGIMPGDIRYRDVDGNGVIDVNDAVHIGFPETPRMVYGFSGFINYKNWEFSFAFQGSGKRGFFINPSAISPFVNDRAMLKEIYESHWTEKNVENRPFWPRLSVVNITEYNKQEDWSANLTDERRSTYFMRECHFLRCTSLELAYNLPQSLRQKLRMQNVKFFARANNPFLISNFKLWDVELGGNGFNYPIQKTYALGINISF
ncbi:MULTISPECIES: SusC/RagA family TonB-linked outer membrane protein [Butyricimonas]|uniref:SusC/RagA family TonB-linked outer membrane protein n=1 Tax=Butyricimonas TaxID=574697 RepID=UPI0007FB35AE|nr:MULTISPECIES: TonB-dependent receptor [Butyricimonas]